MSGSLDVWTHMLLMILLLEGEMPTEIAKYIIHKGGTQYLIPIFFSVHCFNKCYVAGVVLPLSFPSTQKRQRARLK